MKKSLNKFLPVFALLPLIIGTIGYLSSGEMFSDALYCSFALYFTSHISDAYNVYIEIARWTAPLVTATTILCVLQNVWESFKCRLDLLFKKDSVAVYSDMISTISFEKGVSAIYPGEKFKRYADTHIILFSSDELSLQFYNIHKKELALKNTYIGIKDIECGLLDPINNVTLFDVNSVISRLLWKEISLWDKGRESFDIAIWGSSNLAGEIFSVGLQLNLFSLNQSVRYHIISDNTLFRHRHSNLKLMNDDEVYYYSTKHPEIWNVISNADIVIIADTLSVELTQTILVKSGENPIYYYSPNEGDMLSYISYGSLIPFGRNEVVFTDDNIRRKKTIKKAIALNEFYAQQFGTERNWESLSGFIKSSNISAADFGEVLCSLNNKRNEEELARLEHIRWCRFHYLNYYSYGTPESGKNKDDKRRIHRDLVDYDELDTSEQIKDLESIRITQKL